MTITTEQVKAARALLHWSQGDLAKASGVSLPTIKRLESQRGELRGYGRTGDALRTAIEAAGVIFLDDGATTAGGPGVRLKE